MSVEKVEAGQGWGAAYSVVGARGRVRESSLMTSLARATEARGRRRCSPAAGEAQALACRTPAAGTLIAAPSAYQNLD